MNDSTTDGKAMLPSLFNEKTNSEKKEQNSQFFENNNDTPIQQPIDRGLINFLPASSSLQ
jgi:hypothetical protein